MDLAVVVAVVVQVVVTNVRALQVEAQAVLTL